jgi:hypothetical protein
MRQAFSALGPHERAAAGAEKAEEAGSAECSLRQRNSYRRLLMTRFVDVPALSRLVQEVGVVRFL